MGSIHCLRCALASIHQGTVWTESRESSIKTAGNLGEIWTWDLTRSRRFLITAVHTVQYNINKRGTWLLSSDSESSLKRWWTHKNIQLRFDLWTYQWRANSELLLYEGNFWHSGRYALIMRTSASKWISDYKEWNIIYTERGWLRFGHITSGCSLQGHKIKVYEMRMREDEPHGESCGRPSIHNKHAHAVIPTSNKIKMQLLPFIPLNNTFSVSVYLLSFFLCLRLFRLCLFCFLSSILSLLDSFYILNYSWTLPAISIVWKSLISQC